VETSFGELNKNFKGKIRVGNLKLKFIYKEKTNEGFETIYKNHDTRVFE